MYFASRLQAGRMLAEQLLPYYKDKPCAVMALSDGGTMVGAQIAQQLDCILTLLMSSDDVSYFSAGRLADQAPGEKIEDTDDYFFDATYEQPGESFVLNEYEKIFQFQEMNRELTKSTTINPKVIHGKNVIVVADGLKKGYALDLAAAFLKPIPIEKFVVAVPLASEHAVDRMHALADELYCVSVLTDYIDTPHYYNKQDIPKHATVLTTIEDVVAHWK
jgi:putative phosphoribosyl transferase